MKISQTKLEMLSLLKKQKLISGEELSKEFNISRTAIWKNIQALNKLGYEIRPIPARGYCLEKVPDLLYPWELNTGKMSLSDIYYFNEIDSTNKFAATLSPPALVLAEKQGKGRGRLNRNWFSFGGGIYFSLVVKPDIDFVNLPTLSLVTSVAGAEVIRENYSLDAKIKWPNDILIEKKKVCGILVEAFGEIDEVEKVIIGVGVNANQEKDGFPEEIKSNITTLSHEVGAKIDRAKFASWLMDEILRKIKIFENNPQEIMDLWKNYSCTLGEKIEVSTIKGETFKGKALDIESSGALILENEMGQIVKITSGDVSL